MSHFSTIKTKITEKTILIEALNLLGHWPEENQELSIYGAHSKNHSKVNADLAITEDIGFKLNPETKAYDLVAELDTWDLDVPVQRFIDKLTQQYAKVTLLAAAEEEGFTLAEEHNKIDNTIELVVNRWS